MNRLPDYFQGILPKDKRLNRNIIQKTPNSKVTLKIYKQQ